MNRQSDNSCGTENTKSDLTVHLQTSYMNVYVIVVDIVEDDV